MIMTKWLYLIVSQSDHVTQEAEEKCGRFVSPRVMWLGIWNVVNWFVATSPHP